MARPNVRGNEKPRTIYLPDEDWQAIKEKKTSVVQFVREAVKEKLNKVNAAEEKISKIKEIVNQ